MEYQFFISYSHKLHSRLAENLYELLDNDGYDVWFDLEQSYIPPDAESLESHILDGINNSQYVISFETYKERQKAIAIGASCGYDNSSVISSETVFHWHHLEIENAVSKLIVMYYVLGRSDILSPILRRVGRYSSSRYRSINASIKPAKITFHCFYQNPSFEFYDLYHAVKIIKKQTKLSPP